MDQTAGPTSAAGRPEASGGTEGGARPPGAGRGAAMRAAAGLEGFLFGPRAPADPGRRSREAIERMHRSSETLVGGLQVCAILFFGGVYAITPKAFPPTVPFEPVPIVLGVYAAITVGRLALARAGRLTRPLVLLSAVIDVAVLMVTIWSFHLQYGVEPSAHLKAPTLLYVFILIALRALRLEAAPVLVAGGAAIVGWGALFAHALAEAAPGAVTRDWGSYVTSDRILVGAEVDKLLAIAAVTGVLAVSVASAEATLAVLGEYHARIVPLIHRHGGAIDKYLGDGILATFGAVRPDPEHAARGMAALRAILQAGEDWRRGRAAAGLPAPAVCAAMDAGPVTLGVVGVDGRYEFTILGDVVNRVAKLDKLGRGHGAAAMVTEAAYAADPVGAGDGLSVRRVAARLPWRDAPAALVALTPRGRGPGETGA